MMLNIRIRRARNSKGFSQADLARQLNVNRSAVANWECAVRMPSSGRLQQLAIVTEVSFEWLATGRGVPSLRDDWIPAADAQLVEDPDELRLLRAYRACMPSDRRNLLKVLAAHSPTARRMLSGNIAIKVP